VIVPPRRQFARPASLKGGQDASGCGSLPGVVFEINL